MEKLRYSSTHTYWWVVSFNPARFTLVEKVPSAYWIRGWMWPRCCLDYVEKGITPRFNDKHRQ